MFWKYLNQCPRNRYYPISSHRSFRTYAAGIRRYEVIVMKDPTIRVGTSAFTPAGWPGTFYPRNLKPGDYLTYYAQRFDAVV
jgi:hypothetical protein